MVATTLFKERVRTSSLRVRHDELHLRTRECLQFVDITDQVSKAVAAAGVWTGIVNVQTRHTTTAIVVNEAEPLLIQDMKAALERLAPRSVTYEHDDMERRQGPLPPDEPVNGHSHCKALFLGPSQTLNVTAGRLDLGQWQRVFMVELCSPRDRTVSLTIMGDAA